MWPGPDRHINDGRLITPGLFETGVGQVLTNVHWPYSCSGAAHGSCVIHNPSNHHMRGWPTLWRADRKIMERICPHGVGHPDPDQPWDADSHEWIHGCDGCCS